MEKDLLRDKKYQLLHILQEHNVEGMKKFMEENPEEFEKIPLESRQSDDYLFDLLHVYKAQLLYMGAQHYESVDYCLAKGLVKLSPEAEQYYQYAKEHPGEILPAVTVPQKLDS